VKLTVISSSREKAASLAAGELLVAGVLKLFVEVAARGNEVRDEE